MIRKKKSGNNSKRRRDYYDNEDSVIVERPVRINGLVFERIDPTNPNLKEVVYDSHKRARSSSHSESDTNYNSSEDYNSGGGGDTMEIGNEVDDLLYGHNDNRVDSEGDDDDPIRLPSPHSHSTIDIRRRRRTAKSDGSRPSNWRKMGERGKRSHFTPGRYSHDYDVGTPLDAFDFDTMKRHLQRLVEWQTKDVIELLGGISLHTGKPHV